MATLSDRYNERPYRKLEMAGLRKRVLELEQQVEQLQEMMPINTALLARNGELERQLAEHHTRVQHPMEMGKWVSQDDWEALVKERNQLRDELEKYRGENANLLAMLDADDMMGTQANNLIGKLKDELAVAEDHWQKLSEARMYEADERHKVEDKLAASQEVAGKMREALVASRPYVNVRVETMIDAALALDTGKVSDRMSRLEAVAEAARAYALDRGESVEQKGQQRYALCCALQELDEEGEKDA